ncbi:restriction endonuclease subunit S [Paenibacillus sp. FSL W8-0919]|uniref:restriction endonuclease subunit S n=1 Tax=Paenibacillus sp. FSL W8-0919 TaxID=2954707 RepID=UPI0030F6CF41
MSFEFKKTVLSEVAIILMGQSPKGEYCNDTGNGVPLLNGPTEFGTVHPTPVQFTIDPKRMALKNDLLFCVRGSTVGRMNWADRDYAIGRGLAAIRPNNPRIRHFVKALISFNLPFMINSSTGSTFPNISKDLLHTLPVFIPTRGEEQEAISNMLGSIDEKININNAINKNLEEVAQALFKRWFIDFEFPNENGEPYKSSGGEFEESEVGLIPKGWKIENFNSVFDLKYGKALKEGDRREGDVPVYGSNGRIGFHNNSLVKGPGIVVGRKGNAGTVNFVEKDFFPIDTTFYVQLKPHCISSMYYAYYELINQNLTKYSSDSAVPGLSKKMVEQNKVIIPIEEKIEEFDRSISSIFQYKSNLEDQSDKLSKIRDTLIPKLMSGEIRVRIDEQELTSINE